LPGFPFELTKGFFFFSEKDFFSLLHQFLSGVLTPASLSSLCRSAKILDQTNYFFLCKYFFFVILDAPAKKSEVRKTTEMHLETFLKCLKLEIFDVCRNLITAVK
jgi:hypothetical protein